MSEPLDATELALRALRHRNRSRHELEQRLEHAGITPDERAAALERLAETGVLSDDTFAEDRARTLARRGAGDAFIRHDLRRHGIEHAAVEHAIAELEPEEARAERVFQRRGGGEKALRYLAGRGFAAETLERIAGEHAPDAVE
jgi:regulatory protein